MAGIHCKAGKGRTGVMICCYLAYSRPDIDAYEALQYYGKIRTKNSKGVTIPSQIRYVYYFDHFLKTMSRKYPEIERNSLEVDTVVQKLNKIRVITVPNISKGGCAFDFKVIC